MDAELLTTLRRIADALEKIAARGDEPPPPYAAVPFPPSPSPIPAPPYTVSMADGATSYTVDANPIWRIKQ